MTLLGRGASGLRVIAGVILFAAGCSNILGIEDNSTKVACVSNLDCAAGFSCVNSVCVCSANCGESGAPPEMGAGTGGGSGRASTGGRAGGGGAVTSDAGSHSTAGSSGSNEDAGASQVSGGVGGVSGSAGVKPAEGGAGAGNQGGAGEGGAKAGEGGKSGECDPDAKSCFVCNEAGDYEPGSPCPAACKGEGLCTVPRSCNGLTTTCSGENCCLSLPIVSGAFGRSCDDSCQAFCPGVETGFPAHLSAFSLDAFEVTVGRFRAFVADYPNSKPSDGLGKNPNNPDDPGWYDDWTDLLPATANDLRAAITSPDDCQEYATYDQSGVNDDLPMNCVTWYEAQAFCIWDGGRLPTDTEWSYAAAGGEQGRYYPWSYPASSKTIDDTYAVYQSHINPATAPAPVGSRPLGRGRWGQYDLAGNLSEWMWDGEQPCYVTPNACDDCGTTLFLDDKDQRGGSFLHPEAGLSVVAEDGWLGTDRKPFGGFRCARNF
jgi:sulfatase modifying factor 1